jgi:hypothetical protein
MGPHRRGVADWNVAAGIEPHGGFVWQNLAEAHVGEHSAAVSVNEHVAKCKIAMSDAMGMHVPQTRARLLQHLQAFAWSVEVLLPAPGILFLSRETS